MLGEKLTSLECIVYDLAKTKLDSAGLDPTLSAFVINGVYRRFQESAYHESLLNQLRGDVQPAVHDQREGTIEDLMIDMNGGNHDVFSQEE